MDRNYSRCSSSWGRVRGWRWVRVGVEWYSRARFKNILRCYGESTNVAEPRNMLLWLLRKERSEVALELKPQWEVVWHQGNKAYRKNKSRSSWEQSEESKPVCPVTGGRQGWGHKWTGLRPTEQGDFKKVDWSQIGNIGSLKQQQ